MKQKTEELEGVLLDAVVAMALGWLWEGSHEIYIQDGGAMVCYDEEREDFCPSYEWSHGGPIIERERINIELVYRAHNSKDDVWLAELLHEAREDGVQRSYGKGPTPLIAAMRAYVAAKFGDEVEPP